MGYPLKPLDISKLKHGEQVVLIPTDTLGRDTSLGEDASLGREITKDGLLVVREMKDDNSCLFRSIAYLVERNVSNHLLLRRKISEFILLNKDEYSQVVLGRPVEEYCTWIQLPNSWGGGIELSIFSQIYKLEIDSIDISTGRIDRFGQDRYDSRIILLYSGIHYDAIVLQKGVSETSIFPVKDELVLEEALELAIKLKKQHKYTDLANFTLKCGVCFTGIKGQKEAQQHAMETGHVEFSEYS